MKILAIILDVLCTFNEGFWLYCIIDTVFERREAWKDRFKDKRILLGINIAAEMMLTLVLNQFVLTSPYTAIIVMLETVAAVYCFWDSDIVKATAVVSIYLSILLIIGSIEISITGMIGGDNLIYKTTMEQDAVRAVYLLICGSMWFFINFNLKKHLRKINMESIKYIWGLSVFGWAGGSFFIVQMAKGFNDRINIMLYVFLMVITACIYAAYFQVKKKELQMRIQITNTQNDMLERNYDQINEFYTANAKLYHDMNHHLDAVYRMLEKDDKEQAKQYIESLREPMKLSSIPLRTGIDMADVILCEMEKKAAVKGISVHMDVQGLLHDIAMEKKDLCALLTNLLDNAVEGAEREIWVQIKPIHRMLIIQIKNDCIKTSSKENGRLKTTKENPTLHGWGMQIIEQIVSKYEGSMEYHVEKGVFSVEIMVDVLG